MNARFDQNASLLACKSHRSTCPIRFTRYAWCIPHSVCNWFTFFIRSVRIVPDTFDISFLVAVSPKNPNDVQSAFYTPKKVLLVARVGSLPGTDNNSNCLNTHNALLTLGVLVCFSSHFLSLHFKPPSSVHWLTNSQSGCILSFVKSPWVTVYWSMFFLNPVSIRMLIVVISWLIAQSMCVRPCGPLFVAIRTKLPMRLFRLRTGASFSLPRIIARARDKNLPYFTIRRNCSQMCVCVCSMLTWKWDIWNWLFQRWQI